MSSCSTDVIFKIKVVPQIAFFEEHIEQVGLIYVSHKCVMQLINYDVILTS